MERLRVAEGKVLFDGKTVNPTLAVISIAACVDPKTITNIAQELIRALFNNESNQDVVERKPTIIVRTVRRNTHGGMRNIPR